MWYGILSLCKLWRVNWEINSECHCPKPERSRAGVGFLGGVFLHFRDARWPLLELNYRYKIETDRISFSFSFSAPKNTFVLFFGYFYFTAEKVKSIFGRPLVQKELGGLPPFPHGEVAVPKMNWRWVMTTTGGGWTPNFPQLFTPWIPYFKKHTHTYTLCDCRIAKRVRRWSRQYLHRGTTHHSVRWRRTWTSTTLRYYQWARRNGSVM